jgi:hypothetical protein
VACETEFEIDGVCLANGDLLLGIGGKTFDAENPEKNRHKLEMYILKKGETNSPKRSHKLYNERSRGYYDKTYVKMFNMRNSIEK